MKQAGRTRRYTRTASKLVVGEQYRTLGFSAEAMDARLPALLLAPVVLNGWKEPV